MRFKADQNAQSFTNDRTLLYSLGIIMCRALACIIGIDESELDFGLKKEGRYYVLYIFDTHKGGCGYASYLQDINNCQLVFDKAFELLDNYTCDCEKQDKGACAKCLVDRKSQKNIDLISKKKVMAWLKEQKGISCPVPDDIKKISPNARSSYKTLVSELRSAIYNKEVTHIELFADDTESTFDPDKWTKIDEEMGGLIYEAIGAGKKVTISRDHTTFTGYDSNEDLVNSKVENLREILKENSLSEIEMDFHKKRLANFTASIATIYVGGFSKVERGERYDRFEDAILATRAAIESGLLPGGGVALYEAAHNPEIKFLFDVLVTPFFLLNKENYRCDTPIKTWEGKNLKTGDIGNLYDMGIVEPYLVVVSALENAVSMGGSILTCECAILNNEVYE